MILRDTRINWVSYSANKQTDVVYDELKTLGLQVVKKTNFTHDIATQQCATIWLLILDNIKQLANDDICHYHANNEAIIYLVIDKVSPNLHTKFTILQFINNTINILHTLYQEEQRILQRMPLNNKSIKGNKFTQLNFYGRSHAYLEMIRLIQHFSSNNESILIKGETGTGKELTARAVHYFSDRKSAPFIPINCGAFNDDLILSELFGYEKGAFTGASKSKSGLLEVANMGTVFLDEVDSLSPKAQVALLRFLQESEIRPIGSNKVKTVNVRVVAASNSNIKKLVERGRFRADLLYRLDVLTINLPPLRQREEDIQLLAQYFLAKFALVNSYQTKVFSQELVLAMQNYLWPGNIRELDNFIKRAYLMTEGYVINDLSLLSGEPVKSSLHRFNNKLNVKYSSAFNIEKKILISTFEKDYLHQILSITKGNISKAAVIAQKERRSFCRLMAKHGLERQRYLSI